MAFVGVCELATVLHYFVLLALVTGLGAGPIFAATVGYLTGTELSDLMNENRFFIIRLTRANREIL